MNLLIIENNSILEENLTSHLNYDKQINFYFLSKKNQIKQNSSLKKFDLIIVSSLLPEFSSFDVVEEIFLNKPKKKIIQILDRKKDKKHKFSKFYLVKPIKINKIISIINSFQNKKKNYEERNFNFKKGFIFHKNTRQLSFKNKKNINLTEKECDILNCLFEEKSYITKKNLLQKVWGFNENVKTRTLETHIYRLRKKIKDRFGLKQFITTNKDSYKL